MAPGASGAEGGPDAGAAGPGATPCRAWPHEPQKVAAAASAAPQWGHRPWTGGPAPAGSCTAAAGAGVGGDDATGGGTGATGAAAVLTVSPQEPQNTAPLVSAAPQRGHAWPPAAGPAGTAGIARVGASGATTGGVGITGGAGEAAGATGINGGTGDAAGTTGGTGGAGGEGGGGAAGRSTWPQAPQKAAVSSTAAPQWGQAISMQPWPWPATTRGSTSLSLRSVLGRRVAA